MLSASGSRPGFEVVLLTNGTKYSNLIPLPLRTSGSVRLNLKLADGRNLAVSGGDCTVEANGVARFVELIPVDMYPGGPA